MGREGASYLNAILLPDGASPCVGVRSPNLAAPGKCCHGVLWPWHPHSAWPNLAPIGSAAARPWGWEDQRRRPQNNECRRRKIGISTTLAATSWHLSAGSLVAGGLRGPTNGAGYGTPNLREGGDHGSQSSTLYVRDCSLRERVQMTESGGPGEVLPCSTVDLAPIEPLAKSSLDRVRRGAPLGLGRISAAGQKRLCRQAGKKKKGISTPLAATSEHLSPGSSGGLGVTGPRNGGSYGVPSIR